MALWQQACTLVLSAFFCAAACAGESLMLAASEYPPYMSPRMDNGGVAVAIVREAFRRAGYPVKTVYLPWARAVNEAHDGHLDGIVGLWTTPERKRDFLFSQAFLDNHIGFFKRRDEAIRYRTLADLKAYTVGTVRGYANSEAFERAGLKTDETLSDSSNLAKLAAHHIDLALIDRGVANYLLGGSQAALAGKLEWLPPAVVVYPMHLGIARRQPQAEKRIADFNRALETMRQDGTLDKMLKQAKI
ncbi:substrate-binding periplasmic protein [Chromobacterium vaccinii]|uniref:substrate-binding periplasmic protein n=1 Tax=Chromobacterium vaccinii TaxID=1108595 RepID=UPI003C71B7E2